MDADHLDRIERIFHAALDVPEDQRLRVVAETCGDDDDLRMQVQRLLDADRRGGGMVDRPALAAPVKDALLGTDVGPYRLVERIGEGGMGIVYRAERIDDEFSHEVAIKLVSRGFLSEQVMRRFRTERQALANLNHPNIARFIDGGTTPDDVPYLVMEYIDGEPIDVYCDRCELSIDERLALFQTVCRAVHAAHQNLIVHRDLKPSNVHVATDGVPKLLDFGIAKILDAEDDVRGDEHTATLARVLTPEFASPEQVRGGPITTVSDVYSLGVVLYGLLTGTGPYRLTSVRLDEIEREICDREPPRPSVSVRRGAAVPATSGGDDTTASRCLAGRRRTTPKRLQRVLRGDIDNIVMMALRKESERRYASAEALADDIERYRTGRPVHARPDTVAYRSVKFVRRNRVGVAAAVLLLASLTAGVVSTSIKAHEAALSATHARSEAESAHETVEFLKDAFLISAPLRTEAELAQVSLLLDRESDRVHRQYAERPHLQANLLDALGQVLASLGLFEPATQLVDEAAAIREREFGPRSLEAALSLNSRGEVLYAQGRFEEAAGVFRQGLELHRTLPHDVHTDVALAANNLASTLRLLGDREEAEALHREALDLRRRGLGPRDTLVAESLNNLAGLAIDAGDYDDAIAPLTEALGIRRVSLGADHPLVAQSLNNLATALRLAGRPDAAEPLLAEALTVLRALRGHEEVGLAHTLRNHAKVLIALDRPDEAAADLEDALDIIERSFGPDHPDAADVHVLLATLKDARGEATTVRAHWEEAVRIRRASLPAPHVSTASALAGYGTFLDQAGAGDAAEGPLRESLEIYRAALPADHWNIFTAKTSLGACLARLGRYEEAEALLSSSVDGLARTRGEDADETRSARAHLSALRAARAPAAP